MNVIYDEIEIEDLDFDEEVGLFTYPCPCGDKFAITLVKNLYFFNTIVYNNYFFQDQIKEREEIAKCPSCSLTIKIIYDQVFLFKSTKKPQIFKFYKESYEKYEGKRKEYQKSLSVY